MPDIQDSGETIPDEVDGRTGDDLLKGRQVVGEARQEFSAGRGGERSPSTEPECGRTSLSDVRGGREADIHEVILRIGENSEHH